MKLANLIGIAVLGLAVTACESREYEVEERGPYAEREVLEVDRDEGLFGTETEIEGPGGELEIEGDQGILEGDLNGDGILDDEERRRLQLD